MLNNLSVELYKRCRRLLLECEEFSDTGTLAALFVIEDLANLRVGLPSARNINDRVDKTIAYLLHKGAAEGTGYIVILLETLRDRRSGTDYQRRELDELLESIRQYFKQASIDQSSAYDNMSAPPVVDLVSARSYEDRGSIPISRSFFGRIDEKVLLRKWIVDEHAQLVAVVGMGGIGKTSLVAQVAEEVNTSFDYIYWRDLRNAPLPGDVMDEFIRFVSHHTELHIPEKTEAKLALLLRNVSLKRCLIVLDNAETILEGRESTGKYRAMYEGYGSLMRALSESPHNSCLIITSREMPNDVSIYERVTESVRKLYLSGLDQHASLKILQATDLSGAPHIWNELIEKYSGNPLALKLVSATIRDWFSGDIEDFLDHGVTVFGGVKDLVEEQLHRLNALGADVLFWLAIERETVSLTDLESDILYWLAVNGETGTLQQLHREVTTTQSRRKLIETLESLDRKSLIEKSNGRFTLQPVIMEHITEKFVESVSREIATLEINLLRRHAIIKASGKEFIRLSQTRLILKPLCRSLEVILGRGRIHTALRQIIEQTRSMFKDSAGYVAGNVLNILAFLEESAADIDFSGLEVRQAFLHEADLRDTNFANCQFTDAVFTEAFANIACIDSNLQQAVLAGGTGDGEVRIWRTSDFTQIATRRFSTTWIRTVAFNKVGSLLAAAGDAGKVYIWDWEQDFVTQILQGHTDRIRSIQFVDEAHLLISGSEDLSVRVWNLDTGECVSILDDFPSPIRSIAAHYQRDKLAIAGSSEEILLVSLMSGKVITSLKGHTDSIWKVCFSADGDYLASASEDRSIRLWDVETTECTLSLDGHHRWVRDVSFAPNEKYLVSTGDDQLVRIWDLESGEPVQSMSGHTNRVQAARFVSRTEPLVASGSDDHSIRIWDASSGQCFKVINGYTNPIWACSTQQQGNYFATGSADGIVRCWNIETRRCELVLQKHTKPVWAVNFLVNDPLLLSGGDDGRIILWNTESGTLEKIFPGHQGWVRSVATSHDNRLIASAGSDFMVKIWDLQSGRLVYELSGHTNRVDTVAFNPDGSVLASGGEDNEIILWDTESGMRLGNLSGHTAWVRSVTFSTSQNKLISGSDDKTIRVWNLGNGSFKTLIGHAGRVRSVACANDGITLASGGSDKTIRLWNIESLECMSVLTGHEGGIRSLSFSYEGTVLISASEDGTVMLWSVDTGKLLDTVQPDRPYENMNVSGVGGLSTTQVDSLRTLGAIHSLDNEYPSGALRQL